MIGPYCLFFECIARSEKRVLQETVNSLLDKARRGKAMTGANKRAPKALAGTNFSDRGPATT